jgi:curved DNA-binding protein CbpA
VSRDHYGVLGVSPTSEDVVIRAAYRALMRRYHPDADPSSEGAQRAQAINAAYSVLSDPEKRARYDGSLAAQGLIKPDVPHRTGLVRSMVPGPAGLIGLAGLGMMISLIVLSPPIGVLPEDALPQSAEPRPNRALRPAPDADAVRSSTDVPTGEEIPNAMLEQAEEFVAPDAPETSTARPSRAEPTRRKPGALTVVPKKAAAKIAIPPREQGSAAIAAREECRVGNGWAEQAICKSANLTALDRQHGLLYAQSLDKADEKKRAALLGSRERFRQKRSACRSENCLTTTYIARLREISEIMARGSQQ